MMDTYKTLIIDDERLAREEVRRALESYPEFEVVGEAKNAEEAIELIEREQPDIIFLDIHMPGKSGFELLEELTPVPEVVFTTAYDQYAVQAFEVNALDYLVKPLREERFARTIEKVRTELEKQERERKAPLASHHKIFIKDGEKVYFIALKEIRLIESLENYARLYFGNHKAMLKRSLNQLEERLEPALFFRANRGQIVNTEYIREIHPYFNNKLRLVLTTGESVEVSGRQSVKFKKRTSL